MSDIPLLVAKLISNYTDSCHHLLSTYYVPGVMVVPGDISMKVHVVHIIKELVKGLLILLWETSTLQQGNGFSEVCLEDGSNIGVKSP